MSLPSLAELDFLPFINLDGEISPEYAQKIGIYAIYDENQTLCYVGYSRDIQKSLQQHLIRRPQQCHWLKIFTCDRPSRTLLEEIRTAWLAENASTPIGNATEETLWTQPIDVRASLSQEEMMAIATTDDIGQSKLLKDHARRIEDDIKTILKKRGLTTDFRFQPKLKEQGLLDLK